MKKFLPLFVLALIACGAPSDEGLTLFEVASDGEVYTDGSEDQLIDVPGLPESEIGSSAEALTIGHRGGTAAPGTRTGNSNIMCDTQAAGQVCVVPRTKTLNWFITTPTGGSCVATANRQAQVRDLVNAWFNAMKAQGLNNTWTLTEVSPGTGGVAFAVDVQDGASCNEGFCTSGTLSQVERYSCITGSTSGLTEGAGFAGSYVTWVGGPVLHIDLKQLDDRGSTNARDANLRRQAVFNGLNRIHGIGQFDGGNARCSSRPNDGSLTLDTPCIVQSTEACLLNSLGDTGDLSNIDYVNTNCGT